MRRAKFSSTLHSESRITRLDQGHSIYIALPRRNSVDVGLGEAGRGTTTKTGVHFPKKPDQI